MDAKMRWVYAFFLLLITLAWAYFSVRVTQQALVTKTELSIVETAGASSVLGVLLTLNVNVNQFFFRKKSPDEPPSTAVVPPVPPLVSTSGPSRPVVPPPK